MSHYLHNLLPDGPSPQRVTRTATEQWTHYHEGWRDLERRGFPELALAVGDALDEAANMAQVEPGFMYPPGPDRDTRGEAWAADCLRQLQTVLGWEYFTAEYNEGEQAVQWFAENDTK